MIYHHMGDTWWDRHVLFLRILGFHTIQVMCRCCGDEELRAIGVRASLGREDRSPGDPTDDAGDLVGDPGSWEEIQPGGIRHAE